LTVLFREGYSARVSEIYISTKYAPEVVVVVGVVVVPIIGEVLIGGRPVVGDGGQILSILYCRKSRIPKVFAGSRLLESV